MKKLLFTLALALCSMLYFPCSAYAQTIPPPYINYQAVLYDVNGANPNNPLINQSFTTFVNINDELGNLLYREEHYASTDANGLITVKMGDGLYTAGPITNFNQINWGVGKYYLVVDFVINGTTSSTAPEQLVTVPYSFFAGKAGNGMTAVADNGNGSLTFTYANGATYITPILSGITGAQGPIGPSGASGAAGPQGPIGLTGVQGPQGIQGPIGLTGAEGPQGIQGIQGVAGVNGTDGRSAYEIAVLNGFIGTETQWLLSLVGATGTVGATGATGAQGPQGIQGPVGNDGATGAQGPTGLIASGTTAGNTAYWDGTAWVTSSSNIFNNGGNVGIGTTNPTVKLEVNGRLKTQGINELSDVRYKKDIQTLTNALANIEKLRGVSYDWKQAEFPEKNFDAKHQIGLIAQELELVFPELVNTDAEGYKSVDYSKLVAVLIEAVKEQQTKITTLQGQVENQAIEMNDLKASVSTIFDLLNTVLPAQMAEK